MQHKKRVFTLLIAIVLISTLSLSFLSMHSASPLSHHIAYADEKENNGNNDDQDNNQDGNNNNSDNVNSTEELLKKANNGDTTEKEDDELNKLRKQNIVKNQGDKWVAGDAYQADSNLWTLYSRILMESGDNKDNKKEKEEGNGGGVQKMVKNAIGSFMGDGGVEVDIPFNEMYSIGKDLGAQNGDKDANSQAGRQLASFFSTFSHYGYVETVSGNTLAAKADGAFNTIMRYFAGLFCLGAILIHGFFNGLLGWIVSFLAKFDVFSILGYNDPDQLKENASNPFVKAVYGFVQGVGLSPAFFNFLVLTGFYAIVGLFVYRMMRTLSSDAFHFGQFGDHTKRLIIRFLTFFPVPVLIITLVSGFASQLDNIQNNKKFNPSPAQQYILNDRKWAASQNLSPNALQQENKAPNAGSDKQHIDGDYAPSNARNLISNINYESYNRMDNINDESSMKMSLDLIFGYMQNGKFNVNTYMSDIRQTPASGDDPTSKYSAFQNIGSLGKKVDQQNYKDYIWTAKPVSSSNEDEAKPTDKKYKPQANAGVDGEKSFSTQSVALMLQTSFEDHAANFYAYNIPPTGIQGQAKNMSTVKTEWREYTLPGEGLLGKSGSYMAMVTQAIFQSIVILGCIHALLFTNFFKATILAVKHWLLGLSTGNPAHMLVCLLLGLTSPMTGFIAYALPSLLVSAINLLVQGVNGVVKAFGILNVDGVIDLGKSIVFLFAGFYLVISKTVTGTNIITTIIGLPTDIGLNLAKRAQSIMRSRQQFRHAIRLANRTAREVSGSAASNTAAGMNKSTMGATWNAATTPSEWASHGVNYITNKTSNSNDNQDGKESANAFAARQGGAANTGRSGTARSTLLGAENPNPSRTHNPYGGHNYFAGTKGNPTSANNNGTNNKPVDPENHKRNNQYKNTADSLPSAMKSGSANDFAKDISRQKQEQAKKSGEAQANKDIKNTSTDINTPNYQDNNRSFSNDDYPTTSQSNHSSYETANDFASQQPPFSDRELKTLNTANNESEFQEKLYYTNNGQYAALSQDSAKQHLQGTKFVNDDGDIDYNKLDQFNDSINGKHLEDLDNDSMRQKEQLDYAFRQGASSIYSKYDNIDVDNKDK
ncbi:DUF4013 domain-containing protein [Staphylococcus caledonicus]|uniref:DUF4013 domain-containing protein n=1 Tax=Staphylococcus caledonicus TaxID=2741333 RepID=UPI0018E47585|nr:DUF4013 domain-containing protein [Staphylococcus caledonicus]MBI5973948.1 DUF4013 domain-containing protein [Staphylococcus caledonicus]